MKTYKKTIEAPRLEIFIDHMSDSPRNWDNLGYFITCERKYKSPDDMEDLKSIIQNLGDESKNVEEHMEKIKAEMPEFNGEKVLYITPVYKYEHSSVSYHRGTAHGFDYSNCGFYIITDKTKKLLGTKKKDFESVIDEELKLYNQYITGDVYGFTLYDEDGEIMEQGGNIYGGIEEIAGYLPDEFDKENIEDYLIN